MRFYKQFLVSFHLLFLQQPWEVDGAMWSLKRNRDKAIRNRIPMQTTRPPPRPKLPKHSSLVMTLNLLGKEHWEGPVWPADGFAFAQQQKVIPSGTGVLKRTRMLMVVVAKPPKGPVTDWELQMTLGWVSAGEWAEMVLPGSIWSPPGLGPLLSTATQIRWSKSKQQGSTAIALGNVIFRRGILWASQDIKDTILKY